MIKDILSLIAGFLILAVTFFVISVDDFGSGQTVAQTSAVITQ